MRLLPLFLLLVVFACNQTAEPAAVTEEGEFFGAEFDPSGAKPVAVVLNELAGKDTLDTKIVGTVESVCKKKGCWANVTSTNTDQEFFVKFKDYAFFLPLDCEGREVVLEGKAYREVTSVDELRHYAEDEGASEEEINAITEPTEELKFMASGAFLRKPTVKKN